MRLTIPFVIAGALGAGACRNHDDRSGARDVMDRAGEQARKADQSLRAQHRDRGDLDEARARWTTAARTRLASLDDRLAKLKAKGDIHARMLYADLRVQRDELAAKVDQVSTQMGSSAQTGWDDLRKGVDDTFDKLEKDLNDALQ